MLIQFVLMDGSYESYPKSNANQEKCMKQIIAFGFENNDSFDDDILNSTKCYLPFKDCMYSFKDKRTYPYDEKPDIHFVQRINRNFPTRSEGDITHVMNKILKPIF